MAEKIGVGYDTVRRWCLGHFIPDGGQLLIISQKLNVSLDWLLAGQEKSQGGADEFCSWNPEVQDACRKLKEIMESGDAVASMAIQFNLEAFSDSVRRNREAEERRREIQILTKKVRHLEKLTGDGKSAGIGAADDTGIKKKAM